MAFWALDTQHETVYTDLPSPSSMKGKMSRAFQNRPNRHPVILIYNLNLNKRQTESTVPIRHKKGHKMGRRQEKCAVFHWRIAVADSIFHSI